MSVDEGELTSHLPFIKQSMFVCIYILFISHRHMTPYMEFHFEKSVDAMIGD